MGRYSGLRLMALGLATLWMPTAGIGPSALPGAAAAQEARPELVGPEHDVFMAALGQLNAVTWMVEPERRLAELRAVQATLHRLAAEYPDSLGWAVLGRSLHAGPHPAEEIEQEIADVLALVDQGVALHEANRAVREERCSSMAEACRLVADAQATAESIHTDDGASGRRTADQQRFAALVAIAAAQAGMGLTGDAQVSLGGALVAAPEIDDVQLAANFARVLALAGDPDSARLSFAYAKELVLPDAGLQTIIQLNAIAVAQARAGLEEEAARTFAEALAIQGGLGRTVIVRAQVEAGLYAAASAAASDIANISSRAAALGDIAAAQAGAGALEDARQTLDIARSAFDAVTAEDTQRAIALSRLANAQRALGQTDPARTTLADALAAAAQTADATTRLNALIDIGSVLTGAGMHEEAGRVLADAAAHASTFEDVPARLRYLVRIGELQADAGFSDEARRSFSQASAAAALTDGFQHLSSMKEVARGQAGAGFFDDAFATAAALAERSPDGLSHVLEAIVTAQAVAGHFADARATADRMPADGEEPPGSYYRALADIATAQAAAAEAALAAE